MKERRSQTNSIFLSDCWSALFFSLCFPLAMALQREQGCLPSNVRSTAWARDLEWRLSASIAAQATVWRIAHCSPMEQTRAITRAALDIRVSTLQSKVVVAIVKVEFLFCRVLILHSGGDLTRGGQSLPVVARRKSEHQARIPVGPSDDLGLKIFTAVPGCQQPERADARVHYGARVAARISGVVPDYLRFTPVTAASDPTRPRTRRRSIRRIVEVAFMGA